MRVNSGKGRHHIAKKRADKAETIEALVAFIDLLGFSERVLAVRSRGDLARVVQSVRKIRDYFDYKPTDRTTREAQEISNTEVLAFSDCVVVSIGLRSPATEVQGEFDIWAHDISIMAHLQGAAVASGHFLRGGLDKGLWYHDRAGVLVSPALVKAYRLEQAAKYPVLAVTESLYRFLRSHPGRKVYSRNLDPFPKMFRSFADSAGKRIRYLNYIEQLLANLDWQFDQATVQAHRAASPEDRDAIVLHGYRRNMERFFLNHKKEIEAAHRAARGERVKEKYAFLRDYHNEILRKYMPDRDDLMVTSSRARTTRIDRRGAGWSRKLRQKK